MCSFWISIVFQDDHTVRLWLADLNRIPQQRCLFLDKRSVGNRWFSLLQTTLSFNSAVRSSGYLLSPTHLVGCVQIISKAWCVWRIMEHSVIHSIFPELDGDKKSRNTNFDQKINGFPKFALKPIQRPQKCADFFSLEAAASSISCRRWNDLNVQATSQRGSGKTMGCPKNPEDYHHIPRSGDTWITLYFWNSLIILLFLFYMDSLWLFLLYFSCHFGISWYPEFLDKLMSPSRK